MGKVIAICNQKGGVGKTTTSINLGISLVNMKKKVLLLDFDPQGNATQGLGYDPDQLEITISTVMKNIIEKNLAFTHDYGILHHSEGIDLMPADVFLAEVETKISYMHYGQEKILKSYLDGIKDLYDFIIIDCPPAVGILSINALVAADEVIIPMQTQLYSVKGLQLLFKNIKNIIEDGANENLRINGILYTRVNDRTNSFREISKIMEDAYGQNLKIYQNYIPQSVTAEDAPSYGQSIFTYAKKSTVAIAYQEFANEFLDSEGGTKCQ